MSNTATSNTEIQTTSPQEEDLTYGDIVWGQLRKNTYAIYSLYMLLGLFAIAIYSPLIASDRPFIWSENGVTTYPWFSFCLIETTLKCRDIFSSTFCLLHLTHWCVVCWIEVFSTNEPLKRPRRRKIHRMTFILIALIFGTYITMLIKPYEEPYCTYHEDFVMAQEDDSINIEATLHRFHLDTAKLVLNLDKPSSEHWRRGSIHA